MSLSSNTTSESRGNHRPCNPPIPTNFPPQSIVSRHHHQLHHPFYNPHFHPCFRLSPGILRPMSSSHTATVEPHCSSRLPQPPASISVTPTNSFRLFHHHYHGCPAFCQRVPYHPCRRLLLPPPPCGFSLLHEEQHQNHKVVVPNSGLQEMGDEAGDEEEDDDPVFVMTDEWLEFFAKSEAKRQQDKKLKGRKVGHPQKRKGSK